MSDDDDPPPVWPQLVRLAGGLWLLVGVQLVIFPLFNCRKTPFIFPVLSLFILFPFGVLFAMTGLRVFQGRGEMVGPTCVASVLFVVIIAYILIDAFSLGWMVHVEALLLAGQAVQLVAATGLALACRWSYSDLDDDGNDHE